MKNMQAPAISRVSSTSLRSSITPSAKAPLKSHCFHRSIRSYPSVQCSRHSAEGRHEVAIQPGNLLRVAGRSGWRDDTFPSIAETSPGNRRQERAGGIGSGTGRDRRHKGETERDALAVNASPGIAANIQTYTKIEERVARY